MPEPGGPTTQAGVFFQNTVAAYYLARMLRDATSTDTGIEDRVTSVRCEAPEEVDDVVVRFQHGVDRSVHYVQAKLSLSSSEAAWTGLWRHFWKQFNDIAVDRDRLVIWGGHHTDLFDGLQEMVKRAQGVPSGWSRWRQVTEFTGRLTKKQLDLLDAIVAIIRDYEKGIPSGRDEVTRADVFELLLTVDVEVKGSAEEIKEYATAVFLREMDNAPDVFDDLRGLASDKSRVRGALNYNQVRDVLKEKIGFTNGVVGTPEQQHRRILLNYQRKYVRQRLPQRGSKDPLHGAALIELRMKDRRDLIDHPLDDQHAVGLDEQLGQMLPAGTDIVGVFKQRANSALLIVGAPGSGKSTMLFKLADALIASVEEHGYGPIPVIISLSSWPGVQSDEQESLADRFADWVVGQLSAAVLGIGPDDFAEWVSQGRLILLLYGLESLEQEHRETCVQAINTFLTEKAWAGITLCSDTKTYEGLTRLQFQGAVELQDLGAKQVDAFLESAGDELVLLRTELQGDEEKVKEFARTPGDLKKLIEVYLKMPSDTRRDFDQLYARIEASRKASCKKRVHNQLEKRDDGPYTQQETVGWLTWLADRMDKFREIPFYIDQMQPGWLATRAQQRLHTVGAALTVVFLAGLSAWWVAYTAVDVFYRPWAIPEMKLFHAQRVGPLLGLAIGLFIYFAVRGIFGPAAVSIAMLSLGVAMGIVFGSLGLAAGIGGGVGFALLVGLAFAAYGRRQTGAWFGSKEGRGIEIVDRKEWSWSYAVVGVIVGMFVAVGTWLLLDLGVLMGQDGDSFGEAIGTIRGFETRRWRVFGLPAIPGISLFLALLFGLQGGEVKIDERSSPNQGIRRSAQSAVIIGGGGMLLVAAPFLLLSDQAQFGLALGLLASLFAGLRFGGFACLQHWLLRLILCSRRYVPLWGYARFLEYATRLEFLAKAGRGYEFRNPWWECFKEFELDRPGPTE